MYIFSFILNIHIVSCKYKFSDITRKNNALVFILSYAFLIRKKNISDLKTPK